MATAGTPEWRVLRRRARPRVRQSRGEMLWAGKRWPVRQSCLHQKPGPARRRQVHSGQVPVPGPSRVGCRSNGRHRRRCRTTFGTATPPLTAWPGEWPIAWASRSRHRLPRSGSAGQGFRQALPTRRTAPRALLGRPRRPLRGRAWTRQWARDQASAPTRRTAWTPRRQGSQGQGSWRALAGLRSPLTWAERVLVRKWQGAGGPAGPGCLPRFAWRRNRERRAQRQFEYVWSRI